MKIFLGLILLVAVSEAPIQAEAPPRPYHVEHYDVSLHIDLAAQNLTGEAAIRFRSLIERLDEVELDAGDLEIQSVAKNKFIRRGSALIVSLNRPLRLGEQGKLAIRYRAKPARGLKFFPDQVYTVFFTSDWMVCNERPEDRATLRLKISAPTGAKVAASGRRVNTSEWALDTPTPPFVFGFAVGDFVESFAAAGAVRLRYLGRVAPETVITDATASAMQFLTEKSGVGFPGSTYTQVFAHGNPEQEIATLTLLPEKYPVTLSTNPDDLWLLVHELAHQWYGIAITSRDWSDFWLNEGMATFLANAYLEQRFGRERYDKEIASSRKIYEDLRRDGKDRPLSFHDWTTPQQAGGRLPYHKGAWFLHLLRQQLGDDAFWRGLQRYTKDHWNKRVVSADFQKSMEGGTGVDLSPLFSKWIY